MHGLHAASLRRHLYGSAFAIALLHIIMIMKNILF